MFFFLPLGPALCKLGLVRSAVLPEVLPLVLGSSFDHPLFYFHWLFSSLSFSHRHFGLLFPTLTTGFSNTWTVNFLLFKLVLEKAEEPEIKLPTSARSWKYQEHSRKTSTSALSTMPKPWTVWITTNWNILKEIGIPDRVTCLLRNLYAGQEATVRTGHGTTDWPK